MHRHPIQTSTPALTRFSRLERTQGGVGSAVLFLPVVDSTNRRLAEMAREPMLSGTVLVADHQTAGRGKGDRPWISRPGTGLILSVLLRPARPVEELAQVTLVTAVAVADAIAAASGLRAEIKWPNDLMVGGRKLCGILCEMVLTPEGELDHIIAGIGINVQKSDDDFPAFLQGIATSIETETGKHVHRYDLLGHLIDSLEARMTEWEREGFEPARQAWSAQSCTLGREIVLTTAGAPLRGIATALEADGTLTLRDAQGQSHNVVFGEISSPPEITTHGAFPRTAPAKEENESK
ncbi:biotin--[acetyl-CoA-carboxylase] ligase [Rhodobacter sp. TJ_12]|nr:biotin--[acetyl-CoA-carboxylase] ligase [Rhodobacter sp. TJ_12]